MQQPHSMQSTRRSYSLAVRRVFFIAQVGIVQAGDLAEVRLVQAQIDIAHIHHQVADHREVAQRLNPQRPAIVGHRADGGDAGQLFHAVDAHTARPAGGMVAGVPEGQAAVVESPDAFDAVQHIFIRVDLQLKGLRVRRFIALSDG